MARLNDEQRQRIMADFHIGKSQNELAKIYNVSPATINKLCKGITPKHAENVNTLTRINAELTAESEYQVNAIHKEVDQRVKRLDWLRSAAMKNVSEAMKAPCDNQQDFRARAETINKAVDTVEPKTAPTTAIQINNDTRPKRTLADFYAEEGQT